jgi:transposase
MMPTTPERRTRDYVRHGTTSLFAAYDLASGSVIAQHYRRHRHQEFLRFLKLIDTAVPKDLDLHLVLDNLSAHKAPPDQRWLLAHPRVQLHFTPTCSSWISQVERWFAELQRRCLDRGVFCPPRPRSCPRRSSGRPWRTAPCATRSRTGHRRPNRLQGARRASPP